MNSQRYFEMAQLSEASYADFLDDSNDLIAERELIESRLVNAQTDGDRDFSQVQAEQFTDPLTGYTVLEQSPTIANGLSATLFLDNETGEKILSIRGSNDGFDFVTDAIDIAFLGTAELQSQYQSLRDFYSRMVQIFERTV